MNCSKDNSIEINSDLNRSKYSGWVIISDMDHTLLNNDGSVSDVNKQAILEFIEGGGLFGIATGRTIKGVEQFGKQIPTNIPGIVFNGAVIYDFEAKSILWSSNLDIKARKAVKDVMEEFPDLGVELHSSNGELYIIRRNEETDEHMKRENVKPIYTSLDLVPDLWYKVILTKSAESIIKVEHYLNNWLELNGNIFRTVYTEPQFLELLAPDVSKGKALERLATQMKINLKNIIAIGDNMNDIEMLKIAGVGVAVSNALEQVKYHANVVGCHNSDNIIMWILSNLDL